MKDLLEKVKKELLSSELLIKFNKTELEIIMDGDNRHIGLCYIFYLLRSMGEINTIEHNKLTALVKDYRINRKVFYGEDGKKTPYINQFIWKPNSNARIKWLNKEISKHS